MIKKTFKISALFLAAILLISGITFNKSVAAYFSSVEKANVTVGSGSVDVAIENLRVDNTEMFFLGSSVETPQSQLKLNSSITFSFTVSNFGKSNAEYDLHLQIAFDGELRETGKFFIYPFSESLTDEQILENISQGNYNGAIVNAFDPDNSAINMSTGIREGVTKLADTEFLSSQYDITRYGTTKKDYKFKLFFYNDFEISLNPTLFHNTNIEVDIVVNSFLPLNREGWSANTKNHFRLITITDFSYPVISEVQQFKTFFILQAGNIDLKDYATAHDVNDGDITDRIVINSVPEFNPQRADVYTITFNVKNSFGFAAVPLNIQIVVWDFVKIDSGNYHTLALTSHGKVYAWGYNLYGSLGDGTTADKATPMLVEGLENIVDIAAGYGSSFALASDGQAYAWGRNDNGRLGDNSTTVRRRPVKVAQPQGVKFVSIESTFGTSGAVDENGNAYIWGYGGYGAAAGDSGDMHTPKKLDISDVKSIALGYYNGAVVTNNGELYTWGDNLHGQLGRGLNMAVNAYPLGRVEHFAQSNIKIASISCGWYHMSAVTEDGNLYTWGYGAEGRLGNDSAADRNTPQSIDLPYKVVKAEAGYYHTALLSENGTVYFAGQNVYGKHGTGNATNHYTFTQTHGAMVNVTDITLAYDSSFVLLSGTDVYGMGYGGTGVLGTGVNTSSNTPLQWALVPPDPY